MRGTRGGPAGTRAAGPRRQPDYASTSTTTTSGRSPSCRAVGVAGRALARILPKSRPPPMVGRHPRTHGQSVTSGDTGATCRRRDPRLRLRSTATPTRVIATDGTTAMPAARGCGRRADGCGTGGRRAIGAVGAGGSDRHRSRRPLAGSRRASGRSVGGREPTGGRRAGPGGEWSSPAHRQDGLDGSSAVPAGTDPS